MNRVDALSRLQDALGAAYVIERELGGGGMSSVFVADEQALGRRVVVKVLRPELVEGLSAERFRREVRVAARLQHPHIVPLLTAGDLDDGGLYYTMPFVEGESLRARIASGDGGLPVADVVRIVRDVADALAYAHAQGVVHRDIKPENILLSHGGSAVVADFGIAKAISASRDAARLEEGDANVRRSSTLTAAGTSLGTPTYMAPEQAVGGTVDHRADLYALGVVAYELLAGRPPFDGRGAQQLLAAHAIETPEPIVRRRPTVPSALASLVMRLLEKNPADRPQSADEVLRSLDGLADAEHTVSTPSERRRVPRSAAWVLVAAVAAGVGALGGAALASRGASAPNVERGMAMATVVAPAGHQLRPEVGVALSPSGDHLTFVAIDARGVASVWVRPLDSLAATRVDGTEGAVGPFWSPDGTSLGFFAAGQLRTADLRGGARRALCPAPRPGGGTWTTSGVIVYAPDQFSSPLFRVPATGGACTPLTRLRAGGVDRHDRPVALPDGRRVLFIRAGTEEATLVVNLADGAVSEVRRTGRDLAFVAPHWLFFRDVPGGPLSVQRLDMRTLRLVGEPRVLLEHVSAFRSFPSFAVGARALLAHQAGGSTRSLVWVNRQSKVVDSVTAPSEVGFGSAYGLGINAAVSRDGRRIAFTAVGASMWIHDRDRDVATRVRVATMEGQGVLNAAWGPGDTLIAYQTIVRGPLALGVYHVGAGTSDSLFAARRRAVQTPNWSPDGRQIAFVLSAGDRAPHDEVWIYSFADRRARRAWEGTGDESAPRWSPDGRWIAYVSDETGAPEVYVRAVSGGSAAVRASAAGGEVPRWRGDGRELYYRTPNGVIMTVGVQGGGASATLSAPRVAVANAPFSRSLRAFEVTPDGERFVAFGRDDPPVLTLVLDWAARVAGR
jgi:serine/threonine-protein kinase